jgi:catechol 2,3-dioxygenase-like lactoylglutathione lyase family enzyme
MKRLALGIALTACALAQAKPAGKAVGILNDIHAVQDLDTTLAFYRNVFGIGGNPQDFPNPGVPLLTNAPGVSLRLAVMRLPASSHGFELTNFTGVERKPAQARFTDPGAAALILYVRDIDAVVAAAKKAGAPIVTAGGEAVEAGKARSIVMRDPDGYFVRAIQAAPAANAPEGNVHRVAMGFTMEDAGATLKFYRDMMGFQLTGDSGFSKDPAMLQLVGAPRGAEFRTLSGVVPGTTAPIEFTEFRGVPRTKFHLRVRDPGAPAMAIQVTNLEGMLAEMRAAGVNVISAKGEIVQFSPTVRNIFVEDPNGVNIELFERQPGQGKQAKQATGK